jgi:CheY-like chemotaxis protein
MSDGEMSKIFSAFSQADSSVTRNFGGSGLGLSISKQLVERMGGQIGVESKKGVGTKFYFNLPFSKTPAEIQIVHQARPNLAGIKTLIADSGSTNRMILLKTLNAWSAEADSVESGAAALIAVKKALDSASPFHLLILDSRMPEMTGFEVVEKLAIDFPEYKPVIIMTTTEDRSGDLTHARSLGINSYLVKPIIRSSLYEAISRELGKREAHKKTTPPVTSSLDEVLLNSKPLNILLVDDNEDNRMLILSYLKKSPFKVDIAENGKIALDKVQAGNQYDVIFMDMQMPVMDGLTATLLIRKWEVENSKKPMSILALTANALKEEVRRCLDAGCNAHIAKPVKKIVLLKAVIEYGE